MSLFMSHTADVCDRRKNPDLYCVSSQNAMNRYLFDSVSYSFNFNTDINLLSFNQRQNKWKYAIHPKALDELTFY